MYIRLHTYIHMNNNNIINNNNTMTRRQAIVEARRARALAEEAMLSAQRKAEASRLAALDACTFEVQLCGVCPHALVAQGRMH